MRPMKNVSEEEFNAFLRAYPRQLNAGWVTIAEPPLRIYCDSTMKGPDSVVACWYEDWPQFGGAKHFRVLADTPDVSPR